MKAMQDRLSGLEVNMTKLTDMMMCVMAVQGIQPLPNAAENTTQAVPGASGGTNVVTGDWCSFHPSVYIVTCLQQLKCIHCSIYMQSVPMHSCYSFIITATHHSSRIFIVSITAFDEQLWVTGSLYVSRIDR